MIEYKEIVPFIKSIVFRGEPGNKNNLMIIFHLYKIIILD